MGKLAGKYVALLVEKKILYPVLYRGLIGSQPPRAVPMATSVGEHCEGCGKLNHKRRDCTSGHDPKHLNFNVEGKWIGCATYKTIKAWLTSNDRADEDPIQVDSSSSNRGGSHYRAQVGQRKERGSLHLESMRKQAQEEV